MIKVLAITPPFTQLNTPYPATAYLKGFLNTQSVACFQADLGIEVILEIFSKKGLQMLFSAVDAPAMKDENSQRIYAFSNDYVKVIDAVISFLQGKNNTLAYQICQDGFLPRASRFDQLEEDLSWAFGTLGVQDKAKHLATLYLEDISDFIKDCIDPHFGFSRYAERLGRSASTFDELHAELQKKNTYIDSILLALLEQKIKKECPSLVVLSVPFPGNLYAAFKIAQFLKLHYKNVPIAFGGGFANTELRSVSDPRVFDYVDFICLDDGEAPLMGVLNFLHNGEENCLKRTFTKSNEKVKYVNNVLIKDYKQKDVGVPDYSDLYLDRYISVLEIINPMHRLWSDGRWNKLTMAHGCYWGKCTFCDISLDYIKNYEINPAALLCDRIEELMLQTGTNGFHFVDEAAPPALMRDMAIEILKRGLVVTWWTNIRFEKSFSADLCFLLAKSGCIAVSGGLEVASDRLLELIQKGVTVAQVAQVAHHFTEAGIMVHAYLMYGFPTQTDQETVDSLEMVRQLFMQGILQSGFWHQFAMTAHSPVGLQPEKFKVKILNTELGSFANNDLVHEDPTGTDHEMYSFGLKKSLHNFMNGIGFEMPLQDWFEHKMPKTKVKPDFIERSLIDSFEGLPKPDAKVLWTGKMPLCTSISTKKGEQLNLLFRDSFEDFSFKLEISKGQWLGEIFQRLKSYNTIKYQDIKDDFETKFKEPFEIFWFNKPLNILRERGMHYV